MMSEQDDWYEEEEKKQENNKKQRTRSNPEMKQHSDDSEDEISLSDEEELGGEHPELEDLVNASNCDPNSSYMEEELTRIKRRQ